MPVDPPAIPDDESERRRSGMRKGTAPTKTHIGLHIKGTKYATQRTEVFGRKDIRRKILP